MADVREGRANLGARFMLNNGGVMWQRASFGPYFPDLGEDIDELRNHLADVYAVAEELLRLRSEETGVEPRALLSQMAGE